MRKKISESNIFPQFDLYSEYRKIEQLISEKQIIGTYNRFGRALNPCFSLEDYINDLCFLDWDLRGTFLSIPEMREGLGISKESFSNESITEGKLLDFVQYAANLNFRVAITIDYHPQVYLADKKYLNALLANMKDLLERLNAAFSTDERSSEIFVVYNDELSSVVASEHPEIQPSITEYKKIDNRGDLKRKGEILCTLFKKLESIEKRLNGSPYKQLCSDTTFLFDKVGARHWVEEDKIASKTFLEMEPKMLEEWYDKTFTMFLSCMVISDYLDIHKDIKEIKRVSQ